MKTERMKCFKKGEILFFSGKFGKCLKKTTDLIALILLVMIMAGGCGVKSTELMASENDHIMQKEKELEEGDTFETTKLTVWCYWNIEKHQIAFEQIIDEYNASQKNVYIQTKYITFDDFRQKLSVGASQSQLPDIVIMDSSDLLSYADVGLFEDITDEVDLSPYFKAAAATCTMDQRVYGVPFGMNCLGIFYNEELLRKAECKVPETWRELKKTAMKTAKLSTGSGKEITGFALSGRQGEEGTFNFMPWLWSAGGDITALNSKEGIHSLKFLEDLIKEGGMSREVINWTQADIMEQFLSGEIAMILNGSWNLSFLKKNPPDFKWGVARIPAEKDSVSVIGGENIGIIKNENVKKSLDFVKFMIKPERLLRYMDTFGYISARTDVADLQFLEDTNMQIFLKQMKHSKTRNPHRNWPQVSDAISSALYETLSGEESAKGAAQKAQKVIDEFLKQ